MYKGMYNVLEPEWCKTFPFWSIIFCNAQQIRTKALIYQSWVETGGYVGVILSLHSSHRLILEDVRTFEIQVYAMPGNIPKKNAQTI